MGNKSVKGGYVFNSFQEYALQLHKHMCKGKRKTHMLSRNASIGTAVLHLCNLWQ